MLRRGGRPGFWPPAMVANRTGPLRAIGSVIHGGRQLATAQARIVGPDGKLQAHAMTTCLVFDLAAANVA